MQTAQKSFSGEKDDLGDLLADAHTCLAWACLYAVTYNSLALMAVSQVLGLDMGRDSTLTFLGCKSFSLLDLVKVTRVCLFVAVALGLG